jgi:hypothetical protein
MSTLQLTDAASTNNSLLLKQVGAGVTDDFGQKSSITQMIESERGVAKSATTDYVKANISCSEDDAAAIWSTAGIASHLNFPTLIQEGHTMSALYRQNLVALNIITVNTWEAQRDWMVTTPKDTIMAY